MAGKIVVVDYSMGNIHSVRNALAAIGAECILSSDPTEIKSASAIILPGVGAFPQAVESLRSRGLFELLKEQALSGKAFLGICLGMQLLFEYGNEHTRTEGLGLIKGEVVKLSGGIDADGKPLKIPHIGWNALKLHSDDVIMNGVKDGSYVYFVHSFRADTALENIVASTDYGELVPAMVKNPELQVYGAQFHPEKSHDVGLRILKNFVAEVK